MKDSLPSSLDLPNQIEARGLFIASDGLQEKKSRNLVLQEDLLGRQLVGAIQAEISLDAQEQIVGDVFSASTFNMAVPLP
jgi:hypothetical protein